MWLDWRERLRAHEIREVVDAGANVGGMTVSFLEDGATKVVALEPVPDCYTTLVERFRGDNRVIPLQLGVSDAPGKLSSLNVHNCWTLIPENGPLARALDYVGKPAFDVEFDTIDAICERLGLRPNFLKIDVDGYDAKAWRGARRIIAELKPMVLFEMSYLPRYLGDSCEQMVQEIFDAGYRMTTTHTSEIFDDAASFMQIFPWHSSFDVLLEQK